MIRAFLFDLDGVLTDTSDYHYLAWKRLSEDLGIPFSLKENEVLRGVSRRESLHLLLKGRQVSETETQELMDRKNQYYQEMIETISPANLLPGAQDILIELKSLGIRRAIVSASKNALQVIERLNLMSLINAVVDGNTPARSKPDLFLIAAKKLDLAAADCLVLEDAAAGVEAAHAAGMLVVGLGPVERVGAADLVLSSLEGQKAADILARLKKVS